MSDKESKLDGIREKLYQSDTHYTAKQRSRIRSHEQGERSNWGDSEVPLDSLVKNKPSSRSFFWSRIFLFAFVFFLAAVTFSYISITTDRNRISNDLIDIEIVTRSFVDGGELLPVEVRVTNRNQSTLEDPVLVLRYPGRSLRGGELESQTRELAPIVAGQIGRESFDITLFGEPGEEQKIELELEYRVPSSSSTFVTNQDTEVTIRSTPVQVALDGPETVIAGQPFSFTVDVSSNSSDMQTDLLFELDAPHNFQFQKSAPAPLDGKLQWALPSLSPGEHETITISGTLDGFQGDQYALTAFVGSLDAGITDDSVLGTIFHSAVHSFLLDEPFLSTDLVVNGDEFATSYSVNAGQESNAQIFWSNMLDEKISNVEITLSLLGSAFAPSTVEVTDGFFDSTTGTIVWNQSTFPDFAEIGPGEEGVLDFSFGTLPLVGSGGVIINEPTIEMTVTSVGVAPDGSQLVVIDSDQATVLVNSGVSLDTATLVDTGPFSNSGPTPPRVGRTTTYTLLWNIRNSSNRLRDVEVSATLPVYVDWVGEFSPTVEHVTYDEASRTVTWMIDELEPHTGYDSSPLSVAFQVAFTPSVSQVGQSPALSSRVELTGRDSFTTSQLTTSRKQHTIKDIEDSPLAEGVVGL